MKLPIKMIKSDIALAVTELRAISKQLHAPTMELQNPMVTQSGSERWPSAWCGLTKTEFATLADLLEAGSVREALGLVAIRAFQFGEKHKPAKLARAGREPDPMWSIAISYLLHAKVKRREALALLYRNGPGWDQSAKAAPMFSIIRNREQVNIRPMPRHEAENAVSKWPHRERGPRGSKR